MSLRVWFRPPRLLLLVLLSITLVSASALSWLGWKVLEQQRLLEVQRAQERLEQIADRLAATIVSHEFRTPLTSVHQLSEILALGRVPSEQRRERYCETLVSESKRLQQLVETLLNFGRMEAGSVAVRHLVDNALKYSPNCPTEIQVESELRAGRAKKNWNVVAAAKSRWTSAGGSCENTDNPSSYPPSSSSSWGCSSATAAGA